MGPEPRGVIPHLGLASAPRVPLRTGARLRPGGLALLFAAALAVAAAPLSGQEPPDTVQLADSLAAADSLLLPDSLAADSLVSDSASADTIFHNFPATRGGPPTGFTTGVWEWDRHGIMSSGANTLAELFQDLPGVLTILGGDYGTPAALSTAGQGGAGYRIFRDGFEVYPLDGGVPDLQRIGLVGIGRVRIDRSMGQMVVHMWSHEYDDGRPFSVVEAGTGDLDTNMFRGVFTDPTALFGSLGAGMERIDTRARRDLDEGGNRTGAWARYQVHARDRFAAGVDFRRVTSQTKAVAYTPTTSRTELLAHAGVKLTDGVALQAYGVRSSLSIEDDSIGNRLGGTRDQVGATLGIDRSGAWLDASYRRFTGDLPASSIDAAGGFTSERWGGVSGRYATSSWNGTGISNYGARAWVSPFSLITLFGGYETGTFGSRDAPVADQPGPPPEASSGSIVPGTEALTERETLRVGASLTGWGVTLAGASLYAWSDLALPFGTEIDVGAPSLTGVHRNGYEAMTVLPTPMSGLTVEGSYQWWDEEGPYLPAQIYRGSLEYHRVFKESGNLEVWASVGVRGHDPMLSFVSTGSDADPALGGLARVPFYQSWYGRLQVRVVTVRLWIGMDNFAFRRELQYYPERLLPYGRSFFALRWDLWN